MDSVNQQLKLLSLLFGLVMLFAQSLHSKNSPDESQKLKIDMGLKQILLYTLHFQQNPRQHLVKGTAHPYVHAPHTQNSK